MAPTARLAEESKVVASLTRLVEATGPIPPKAAGGVRLQPTDREVSFGSGSALCGPRVVGGLAGIPSESKPAVILRAGGLWLRYLEDRSTEKGVEVESERWQLKFAKPISRSVVVDSSL